MRETRHLYEIEFLRELNEELASSDREDRIAGEVIDVFYSRALP
jgi:hypothetical protein